MSKLSKQLVCLCGESTYCLSLFKNQQDMEYFQLKLGLGALCQNTLVYQSVDKFGGKTYKTILSPHADEFYCDDCRKFRAREKDCGEMFCNALLERITRYFCESNVVSLPQNIDHKIFKYSDFINSHVYMNSSPSGEFIQYRCPFVECYKFGFPIYVNGQAIAVLFTGQFFLQEDNVTANIQSFWPFWGQGIFRKNTNFYSPQPLQNISRALYNDSKHFDNASELNKFVCENILPVVAEFTSVSQSNYEVRLVENFNALIKNVYTKLDKSFASFINQFLKKPMLENPTSSALKQFWTIVKNSIFDCLGKSEIDSFYLFMDHHSETSHSERELIGIVLQERTDTRNGIAFEYRLAREAMAEFSSIYGVDPTHSGSEAYLFDYIRAEKTFDPVRSEILVNASTLPPFAIAYEFCGNSELISKSFLRNNMRTQFNRLFEKVGQLLTYLSVKLSEYNVITVLRIYRHEITHQVSALDHNLWELEPHRIKSLDENKLKKSFPIINKVCLCWIL